MHCPLFLLIWCVAHTQLTPSVTGRSDTVLSGSYPVGLGTLVMLVGGCVSLCLSGAGLQDPGLMNGSQSEMTCQECWMELFLQDVK